MNSVQIIGRLTRENELRYSASGTAVLRNTIAVNRKFKKDESDFISILAFQKTAELITNHINKGEQLGIEGHIQTGSYEKDGKKVYTTEVVVDNITFIGSKGSNNGGNGQGNTNTSNGGNSRSQGNTEINDDPFSNGGKAIDISDDDLPF